MCISYLEGVRSRDKQNSVYMADVEKVKIRGHIYTELRGYGQIRKVRSREHNVIHETAYAWPT